MTFPIVGIVAGQVECVNRDTGARFTYAVCSHQHGRAVIFCGGNKTTLPVVQTGIHGLKLV